MLAAFVERFCIFTFMHSYLRKNIRLLLEAETEGNYDVVLYRNLEKAIKTIVANFIRKTKGLNFTISDFSAYFTHQCREFDAFLLIAQRCGMHVDQFEFSTPVFQEFANLIIFEVRAPQFNFTQMGDNIEIEIKDFEAAKSAANFLCACCIDLFNSYLQHIDTTNLDLLVKLLNKLSFDFKSKV